MVWALLRAASYHPSCEEPLHFSRVSKLWCSRLRAATIHLSCWLLHLLRKPSSTIVHDNKRNSKYVQRFINNYIVHTRNNKSFPSIIISIIPPIIPSTSRNEIALSLTAMRLRGIVRRLHCTWTMNRTYRKTKRDTKEKPPIEMRTLDADDGKQN